MGSPLRPSAKETAASKLQHRIVADGLTAMAEI